LDTSVRSGDIRAQSRKGSEIESFSVFFAPKIFLGGRSPNFWIGVCKLNTLPTMRQNFAKIGPGTSEISR